MIFIGIVLLGVILGFLIYMFDNWKHQSFSDSQYIKFKTFISFYNINPEHWSFGDLYKNKIYFESYYPRANQIYKFNFIDYYRFRIWDKQREKKKKKQKELQNISEMIEVIKYDLSQLEEENQAKMQIAAKNIRDITSRM